MPDIFISYAREDTAFVRQLVDALKAIERDVWVDFDDIPFASEWWKEIQSGIETSVVGIFIISPDSINSQYCSLEIAHLTQNKKKLVPIVFRNPEEGQMDKLPQVIRDLNWIFFNKDDNFDKAFKNLLEAMDTDLDFAKIRTRLLIRAIEWQNQGQNKSLLARGDELAAFLPISEDKELVSLQTDFLNASLEEEQIRQRFWRFVFGFVGGLLGMGFFTLGTWRGSIVPISVLLAMSVGEVFGLFTGIIALFANDIPHNLRRFIPQNLYLPVQIIVCLTAGILTWVTHPWFFLNLSPTLTWASFLGGIGLSIGFIIHALFKPPAIVTLVITFIGIYLPILLLNSSAEVFISTGWDNPLVYFDSSDQAITVGLPLALLFALGANGQILYQSFFSSNPLTKYSKKKRTVSASGD